MLFSVIVPIYNVERYLRKCVESMLNQTCRDFELILVDDGSADGCPMMCDAFANTETRIRVIHKPNGGLVSARQEGVKVAKGEYCVCVDGDDWVEPLYLEKIKQIIERYRPDIVYCGYYVGNEQDKSEHASMEFNGYFDRSNIESRLFPILIQSRNADYLSPNVWAKAFRTSLYSDIQLSVDPRIKIGEDGACTIPCVYKANSIYFTDEPLYNYRINNESMTREKRPFDWNGPRLIAEHLSHRLDVSQFDFKEQLWRKTVHEVFSVAVSRFYQDRPYKEIRNEIIENLNSEPYSSAIKNARFEKALSAKIMHAALKHRWLRLIQLWSKRR